MVLYHGTTNTYEIGQIVVKDSGPSHAISPVDQAFDSQRDPRLGLRQNALYAAANAAWATAYIQAECTFNGRPASEIHIYKVRMSPFHVGPMAIVDFVRKALNAGEPTDALVREYWSPKEPRWHFLEYLGTEFLVLEEVDQVDLTFRAESYQYGVDRDRLKRLAA